VLGLQIEKGEIIKALDLLKSLAISSQCLEEVSTDLIIGLLKSEGKNVIMVVVDRLKNYVEFLSLSHPFKSSTLFTSFVETIQSLYENPKIIVSDEDPILTSNF
jgi:hypothetical protein